jgi:membrane-associated phospholipid phosphatase
METVLQAGINFILALQALGNWLVLPMKFFTFLGSEEFFLLIMPALYWSIDARLGVRVGTILLVSGGLNNVFKLVLHGPRPYWVSPQVKAMVIEPTFGAPSGHAQMSTGVWGMLASRVKRPWAWPAAIVLILMIGLSRMYLGVHFPHDVFLGWLIGGLVLWSFLRYWDVVETWLKKQSLSTQIGLAFALSTLMLAAAWLTVFLLQGWVFPGEWIDNITKSGATELPAPFSLENTLNFAGAQFGLLGGLAWIISRGGFVASGAIRQRGIRYVLGLLGVLVLWFGLGAILPRGEEIVPSILRYMRYAVIGGWISAGAPYLFIRFNLAEKAHQ